MTTVQARGRSVVALANGEVSILTACQLVGMDLPDDIGTGRTRKVHCPFGAFYHSDGGSEPAMRLYPESNSAWCFACARYYTPVALVARAFDHDRRTAAEVLLDRIGYRPPSFTSIWDQVVQPPPVPDRTMLAEALKTYCQRIDPQWQQRQFDPTIAARFADCLALLDRVRTDADAVLWLDTCKEVMVSYL